MANFFDQFDKSAGNYFDQFDPVAPQSSIAEELTGIPKQVGAGLIEGAASVPGSVPQALSQIGGIVSNLTGLPQSPPVPYALTPQGQLSAALPQPGTGAQQAGRTLGQFPLSAVSARGHLGENVVGGIGAGLGAYLGPNVAPYLGMTPDEGSIAGALLGGFTGAKVAGNAANAVARNKMPAPEEILGAASDTYEALRRANRAIILPRDQMEAIKNGTLNLLRQFGPGEEDAKSVYSIVKSLDSDNGGTVADLINARKNLKGHFEGGPDANKPAAAIALQVIDSMLGKIASPGTLTELKKSDTNWSAARTAQAVDTKVTQAADRAEGANSGMNTGNNIIQNINAYIKSRTDNIGRIHMDPSDLAALDSARKLDIGQRALRMGANAAGGGGGRDIAISAALGGATALGANQAGYNATEGGDPLIAGIGLPALGLLGRHGFNASVVRAAKNAEAAILSRAPYVRETLGLSPPRNLLSTPQIAGRSLLFAAPAIRDMFLPPAQ